VLLAENPPVERCLDIGARSHFANGGGAIVLDLEFPRRVQEARDYLPLKGTGLELDAVKRRIGALTNLRSVPTAALKHYFGA
jgi:hypothetical protein